MTGASGKEIGTGEGWGGAELLNVFQQSDGLKLMLRELEAPLGIVLRESPIAFSQRHLETAR